MPAPGLAALAAHAAPCRKGCSIRAGGKPFKILLQVRPLPPLFRGRVLAAHLAWTYMCYVLHEEILIKDGAYLAAVSGTCAMINYQGVCTCNSLCRL